MEHIKECAVATQEVAKATSKALDTIHNTGGFLDRVFGDLVVDGVGLMADRLKFYRLERYVKLVEKTQENLRNLGVNKTILIDPKIGIRIIENATIECDEYLHTLWANLLSNAMNPEAGYKTDILHVSILKELRPVDAKILRYMIIRIDSMIEKIAKMCGTRYAVTEFISTHLFESEQVSNDMSIGISDVEVSILNLQRNSCVIPGASNVSLREYEVNKHVDLKTGPADINKYYEQLRAVNEQVVTRYFGISRVAISPLGYSLVMAAQGATE